MHKNNTLSLISLFLLALALSLPIQAEGFLSSLGLGGDDQPLRAEEAYRFSAEVEDPNRLRLRWQIAEGTYLYQDKVQVELIEGEGILLDNYRLPEPYLKKDALRTDGSIGELAVYYEEIDLLVPLIRHNGNAVDITLEVRYQGCADRGICYPPMKKQVSLSLPPGAITAAAERPANLQPEETEVPVAEQDRITAILAKGDAWLIVMVFFGAGLALAFTPCVFPMIPILSGIIAGHGKEITPAKGFMLSLVYVLAMALTYTLVGILAGRFGGNLQASFQDPWILSLFVAVFVFLALSMFGFYDLQLPSGLQSRLSALSNRQKGGSLAGVAVMGFLSALIVGPCVAPPLAAALIYIGQTGDATLGGLSLFALSLGMGAPLLLIGASAGKLLPKAGPWMDTVKAVFGVGLLAVAIVMLERIVSPSIAMALWGLLLTISAVYMGALKHLPVEASGWDRLWKGLGVVFLVYGALMLVGAAAGGKDTVQPLRGLAFASTPASASQELVFNPIKTVADLDREVAAAGARNQPVMLDFSADWCVACKELERYTFTDPKVARALSGIRLLRADVTANDKSDRALIEGRFGMPGPPLIVFFDRNGEERKNLRVVGFMEAEEFAAIVQQAAN